MRRHGIKARVATIRYTGPATQRFFDSVRNEQQDLKLERPDQVWVGDITYLKLGITQSMNRPGKVTDNAFIESFFHSMKSEIYHGVRFEEDATIREALKSYLAFYNTDRLHSSLQYVSPATFEQQAREAGCQ